MNQVNNQIFSTTSVTEGIAIGITIAVIVGVYASLVKYFLGREQILHFRKIISSGIEKIINCQPLVHQNQQISVDQIRITIFLSLLRDIDAALMHRSSNMGYKKIFALRKIIDDINTFVTFANFGTNQGQRHPQGTTFYDQHFIEKMRNLDWLKLPCNL